MNNIMLNLIGAGNVAETKDFFSKSSDSRGEVSRFDEMIGNKKEALREEEVAKVQTKDNYKKEESLEDQSVVKDEVASQDEEIIKDDTLHNKKVEETDRDVYTSKEELDELSKELQMLIAQMLNVPMEQVESTLKEMGIEAIELVDLETFKAFSVHLLGQEELTLLDEGVMIKTLSELFGKIENTAQESGIDLDVLLEEMENIQEDTTNETIDLLSKMEQSPINTLTGEQNQADVLKEVTELDYVGEMNEGKSANESSSEEEGTNLTTMTVSEGIGTNQIPLQVQGILEGQAIRSWQQTVESELGLKHTNYAPVNKQIMDQVDFVVLENKGEMSIQLTPYELGKITLQVAEHNGVVSTVIKVEDEKVKELVMENIESLQEGFEDKGLKIGNIQVEVEDKSHHQEMDRQKQKSSKRIQEIIDKQIEALEQEEAITPVHMETEVDLKA